MSERARILAAYSRYLELEDQLPRWENLRRERTSALRELKVNADLKKIEASRWDDPGFFQRLLGNLEEKKEKAYAAARHANAEYERAMRDIAELESMILEGSEEFRALSEQQDVFQNTLTEAPILRAEVHYLVPVAMAAAENCISALLEARTYMQQDARRKYVSAGNRKMEFLAEAGKYAARLVWILELLPEGTVEIGNYLRYIESYIQGVTSEYAQLDRLNYSIEQVRSLRARLREL